MAPLMQAQSQEQKGINVNTANTRSGPLSKQRRSQRILLPLPVRISGERANGSPFSESTHTVVVNAHGALIKLREAVFAGQKLRIKNLGTNEELICKVVDVNLSQSATSEVGLNSASFVRASGQWPSHRRIEAREIRKPSISLRKSDPPGRQ